MKIEQQTTAQAQEHEDLHHCDQCEIFFFYSDAIPNDPNTRWYREDILRLQSYYLKKLRKKPACSGS